MKARPCPPILPPVFAGLLLAGVALWSWWDVHTLETMPPVPGGAGPATGRQIRRVETAPRSAVPAPDWRETAAWIWDSADRPGLFDRPSVVGKSPEAPPEPQEAGIVLLATRDLPFRLQLVGHFGEGSGLRGIFESAEGPLLARSGDDLTGLDLEVRGIGSGPAPDSAAAMVARVWDRRAGREILLPESVRITSGAGAALLAPAGFPGEAVEFIEGEVLELDGREFRVERIGLAPASVTLRRLRGGVASVENDELNLVPAEDPES